ncbi:MAG: TIGR03862 family flavoprotein [Pseudomonadota bacterium]
MDRTKTRDDERADLLIVGGGPAGLAAAEVAAERLAGRPARILLAERMPTVGRKFLMAGKSGLNLTFDAEPEAFRASYAQGGGELSPMLAAFGPRQIRAWAHGLGQETFVGPSGRVFPRAMKASPLLRAWRARLESDGVEIRTRWRWTGLERRDDAFRARFETPEGGEAVEAGAVVMALGGASWPRLGSDGAWTDALGAHAPVRPFEASNVGVEIAWSEHFRARFAGAPIKGAALSVGGAPPVRGECVATAHGLEGGAIYALSDALRARLRAGPATLTLDLSPDRSEAALSEALAKPRGKASTANWLRKAARLVGVKAALLREAGPLPSEPLALAARIKALPLPVLRARPIAEAISTAGGVDWPGIDASLMAKDAPGLFLAGEMIDWDAPTGGYLLTACIATGRWAGESAARWLETRAERAAIR